MGPTDLLDQPVGGDEDLLWQLVGQDWVLVVIGDEKKQVEVMLGLGMMVSQTDRVQLKLMQPRSVRARSHLHLASPL